MRNRTRLLMVPTWILLLAICCFALAGAWVPALTWSFHLTSEQLGSDMVFLSGPRTQMLVLVCFGFLYGGYRVTRHPVLNNRYWAFLATTPWRAGMPLPLGPVELVWQDLLMMAILYGLTFTSTAGHPAYPLLAMLVPYLLIVAIALAATKRAETLTVLLVTFPLSWYVWDRPWLLVAMAMGLCLIAMHYLRLSWLTFPWDLGDRKPEKQRSRVSRPGGGTSPRPIQLAWPFSRLNACNPRPDVTNAEAAVVALLIGWYLLSALHCFLPELHSLPHHFKAAVVISLPALFFSLIFAGMRLLGYLPWTAPPLSLLARLVHGRLILPGYDRIFVAPLIITLVGPLTVGVLHWAGVYLPLTLAIATAIVVFLLLRLPPSPRNWRLTGQYRMVVPAQRRTGRSGSSAER